MVITRAIRRQELAALWIRIIASNTVRLEKMCMRREKMENGVIAVVNHRQVV